MRPLAGVCVWIIVFLAAVAVEAVLIFVYESAGKEMYWLPAITVFVGGLWTYHVWRPPRRSRARRLLKWGGAAVTCLLLVLLGVQARSTITWGWHGWNHVGLGHGTIDLHAIWGGLRSPPNPTWHVQPGHGFPNAHNIRDYGSVPRVELSTAYIRLSLPLLPLFVMLLAFTTLCWHRDRRRFVACRCSTCGYNLTGNVSGRCPECGTPLVK